jgi:predicted nucleotidyltransferase
MVSFRELLRKLKDHDVEFIVIGGVAASLLGSPMATLDVDVCAPLNDSNLSRIIEALRGLHPLWRFRPDKPIPIDSVEQIRGFKNLYISTDIGILDILGELPGVGSFDEIKDRTTLIDLDGFTCAVLDIDTLILSKRAAGRDKDLVGVDHLEAIKKARGL